MTIPPSLFPLLLTTHVVLAISLFLPAFLLPFTMRTAAPTASPSWRPPGTASRAR